MLTNKLFLIVLSLLLVQPIGPIEPKDPLDYDPRKPLGNVQPIEVSVKEFEQKYNQDILLPQYIPFTPTHTGGHYNDLVKQLSVNYLNQKTNEILTLNIDVDPGIDRNSMPVVVTLADGTVVMYQHSDDSVADVIRFQKAGLFYTIGISKNKKKEKLNDLLKVANSLK